MRAFTHGHVQQLDQVGARVLAGLADQVPGLITGAEKADGIAFDVDDTIREVHGFAKQGAAYGYSKVRGLDAQLAVLSTPIAAPVIARARLRRGNVASATGAGRMLAQAISTARATGVRSQILARADSALCRCRRQTVGLGGDRPAEVGIIRGLRRKAKSRSLGW